jgi:WD40 repeat protein
MADGTILRTIKAHDSSVEHLGLSSQGKRVVSVVGDELKLWDLNRPDPSTATSHAGSVSAVTITPNGRRAVSASYDRTLKVWDTRTGAELCTLSEHVSGVNSVAAISDRYVISASHDATLKIWDIKSGRAIRTLQGHEADVKAVAVTPDGKHAVSASFDRTLKHWDLENGEIIQSQPFSIHWTTVVNVTPDGRYALSTPHELDGQVQIHALNHEERPRQFKIHDRFVNAVVGLAGGMAASVSDDGTLKIWSIKRGKVQRTLKGQPRGENALAITPDGQRAITTAWDGTLTVWDLREEVVITRFIAEGQLTSCAISADGTFVIAGEYSGRVHLLRLQTSSPMRLQKDRCNSPTPLRRISTTLPVGRGCFPRC